MALSSSVERVLRLVEEKTGLPVHVEPDAKLPANILAKVTMARGKMAFHRVSYQPNTSAAPDYFIVFQCGFILRRYAVPPADRWDFAANDQAAATVREWVCSGPKTPNLPESQVQGLTAFLYDGLLNQVRSMPVGMRVDEWILANFPELANLQQQGLSRQLHDNAAGLRPEVQGMMPDQALATNLAMSAAFALFWSERLNQPQIVLPYQATGHIQTGRALYGLWQSIPDDPGKDRDLIDAWAEKLNLTGWYHWVPPPP